MKSINCGKNLFCGYVEKKYKIIFPKEIAGHYLTFNGGKPTRNVFIETDGYEYIVNYFIPIKWRNEKGKGNLETTLDLLRVDPVLPEWLIPFAYDPGGDMFCFSTKEEDIGSIYYWSHEYDYEEDPEEHILCLADSLKTFINSMLED